MFCLITLRVRGIETKIVSKENDLKGKGIHLGLADYSNCMEQCAVVYFGFEISRAAF